MHINSLRRQLLEALLWPLAIILLLSSGGAYLIALHAATNAYDLSLLDNALDLSKQAETHRGEIVINLPPAAQQMLGVNNEDRVSYAAWDDVGRLFSGTQKLLGAGALPADENHLFRDVFVDGEENREVLLRGNSDGKDFYIAVSQTLRGRDHLADGIFVSILIPEALLALASIAAILLGVRRGLSPLQLLRDEISSRSPTDLRPIADTSAPKELTPIIHGINTLLANLAAAFAGHRRFIADAAHQLRTPLATLNSQIEVGLEDLPRDTAGFLRMLLSTTQRVTHLTNQLLSLSRLEHTEQPIHGLVVELQNVFLEASVDAVTYAAHKGVDIDFDIQPCAVHGSHFMLCELLKNLLDNAVRYTSAGGKVMVSLQAGEQHVTLTVEDNGIGVPESELASLGIPFHRLAPIQSDGCGLGLAIVREIVRLHGAQICFSAGKYRCGLQACIKFHSLPVSRRTGFC